MRVLPTLATLLLIAAAALVLALPPRPAVLSPRLSVLANLSYGPAAKALCGRRATTLAQRIAASSLWSRDECLSFLAGRRAEAAHVMFAVEMNALNDRELLLVMTAPPDTAACDVPSALARVDALLARNHASGLITTAEASRISALPVRALLPPPRPCAVAHR